MNKLVSLVCLGVLAGCGGGGSSASNVGGGDNGSPTPSPQTIEITAISFDQCDNSSPATNIKVLVHDRDGAIVSTQFVGNNGTLTLEKPSNGEHLTTIKSHYYADGSESTAVETYLSYPLDTLRIKTTDERNGCGCQTMTIDDSAINAHFGTYTMRVGAGSLDSNQMQVCRNSDGQWDNVELLLIDDFGSSPSYAASISIDPDSSTLITPSPEQFVEGQRLSISSTGAYESYNSRVRLSRWGNYANYHSTSDITNLWQFPSLHADTLVSGYRFGDMNYGADFGYRYLGSVRQKVSNGQVALPDWADPQAFEQQVLALFSSEAATTPYDFSDIGSHKSLFNVAIYSNDASWNVDGPLKGSLPDLDLPTDIQALFSDPSALTTYVTISGYGDSMSYGAYLQLIQDMQVVYASDDAKFHEYNVEQISISQ